ncbi:hypothetical protein Tco_0781625, partial [Tanacetum coccineum]
MPFPQFTKIIINHFLKQHKSLSKLKYQHYHTIKDDGIVSRLKFVRIGEDYQEYGHVIPEVMLNDAIKQSESYQMFIKYSTGQISPKKSRGKGSQRKKTDDDSQKSVDVSQSAKLKLKKQKQQGKVTSNPPKKVKGVPSLTPEEQEVADTIQALKESRKTSRRQPGTGGLSEGTSTIPGVPDESTVVSTTSSERTEQESEYLEEDQLNDEEKDDKDDDANDEGDDYISDNQDADDEDAETESDEDEVYKYKIRRVTDAAKADAEKTSEVNNDAKKTDSPPTSSSLYVSSSFSDQFLKLSSNSSLVSNVKDHFTDAEINSLLEIKREQAEKQKMPKNPANHALYHALMEALIEDENAMDKGVADTIKNHKQQNDDDEDEDPPTGPNQGKKTKRRRTKEPESSKKTSTTRETPKGKAPSKGSKTGKSTSTKEPVKEPIAEVAMDDAVNTMGKEVVRDNDRPQDTSEPKTYKTLNQDLFKQPPRPPSPDLRVKLYL